MKNIQKPRYTSLIIFLILSSCTTKTDLKEANSTETTSVEPSKKKTSDIEILWSEDHSNFKNYHILYKSSSSDSTAIKEAVLNFKQENCDKQCNILMFSDKTAHDLLMYKWSELTIDKFNYNKSQWQAAEKKWSEKNWPFVVEHTIASMDIGIDDVWLYPFMDWYYKEVGGKQTSKSMFGKK